MTTPVVTEKPSHREPVEHDPFIDDLLAHAATAPAATREIDRTAGAGFAGAAAG
jgi:hypothetical protein